MHDDSPSSSSLSSPTSSFFFSSTQPSPGFLHSHTPDDALIVPELSLPAQLPQPTAAGPTLGDIRLLVLGDDPDLLITPNLALVDTGEWQDTPPLGRIRVASTSWTHGRAGTAPMPSRNIHIVHVQPQSHKKEEKEEETWSSYEEVVETLKGIIEAPFREVARVIHPDPSRPTDPFLASLLSSPTSPLFTALVILRPAAPAALAAPGGGGELGWKDLAAARGSSLLPEGDHHTKPDRDTCSANTNTTNASSLDREGLTKLIAALAPQIPTILFPPITPQYSALSSSSSAGDDDDDDSADHAISISDLDQPPTTAADTVADPTVQLNEEDGTPDPFGVLSRFVPTSIETLHQGLFASQETLSLIRSEAAERFMRWREAQLVEETIVRIVDESGGVSKRGVKGLDDDDDGAYRVQEGFSSLESLASPRPEVEGEGEEKKRFGSLSLRRRQHQQRLLGRRVGRWSGRAASEREYECGMSSDASGSGGPGEMYFGPSSSSLGGGRKELVILGVLGSQHQQQHQQREQRLGYDIDKAMKWERDSEWMRDVEMHMQMRYSSGQAAPGIAGQGVVGRRRTREGTITQRLQHQHQQSSSGKRSFQEHASSSLHPQSQSYHSSSQSTSYNPAYGYGYQPQHDPTSSIPAPAHGHASYDPLHLPSLLLFSVSLLTPLRLRMQSALGLDGLWDALVLGKPGYHRAGVVRMVLVGGFCVGVGIGFCVGVRMG